MDATEGAPSTVSGTAARRPAGRVRRDPRPGRPSARRGGPTPADGGGRDGKEQGKSRRTPARLGGRRPRHGEVGRTSRAVRAADGARSPAGGSSSARPTAAAPGRGPARRVPPRSTSSERQQRLGVPAEVRAGGEQGPLPRPPLREPDHLAAARGTPRPARGRRSTRGRRTPRAPSGPGAPRSPAARGRTSASVHHAPTHSAAPDTSADPQRVVPRDPGVEPQLLARPEIHGSSPAAPPGQLDRTLPQQAQRPRAQPAGCCPAPSVGPVTSRATASRCCSGAELLDVEEGWRKQASLRTPRRDTAPTTGPRPTGDATARGARPAVPASRSSSSPARRAAGRP